MPFYEIALKIFCACLLFLFTSPSHVAASYTHIDGSEASLPAKPGNVNLSVYYETLSPTCSNFIVKNLEGVFNNDLISIINLRLVPWGDANISKSNNAFICKTFTKNGTGNWQMRLHFGAPQTYFNAILICSFMKQAHFPNFFFPSLPISEDRIEHGPDECLLNEVEACAINVLTNVNKYYGFIYCIEFLAIEGRHKDWQTCFNTLGLPAKPVLDCFKSGNGTKLLLQHAYETSHLIPPHTILPWVLVNNQAIRNDYENFTAYVCRAYKGNVVPNACKLPSPGINSAKKVNSPAKRMQRFIEASGKPSLKEP